MEWKASVKVTEQKQRQHTAPYLAQMQVQLPPLGSLAVAQPRSAADTGSIEQCPVHFAMPRTFCTGLHLISQGRV
eukprot:2531065-Rhodomonas_salina.1